MKHRIAAAVLSLTLVVSAAAMSGCSDEDKPLPEVQGVTAELSLQSPEDGQEDDVVVVSWDASTDSRVEGYVIYRAEQGIADSEAEKSEFEVQAVTIATQYVDDEIRTSVRYPKMRYFYQVYVIDTDGAQGPPSPEVVVEYASAA